MLSCLECSKEARHFGPEPSLRWRPRKGILSLGLPLLERGSRDYDTIDARYRRPPPRTSTTDLSLTNPIMPTPTPGLQQLVKDIQTLAAWGHGTLGQSELESVLSAPRLDWPQKVQRALDRVLSASTASIGTGQLSEYDLRALLPELLNRFTDRQLMVLRHRIFTLTPLTQVAVAKRVGLSRQRISQLQANAIRRLGSVLGCEDAVPVRWKADLLRMKLGNAIPVDAPHATSQFRHLEDICGATVGTSAIPTREFFLHIAGPYNLVDGWLIRRDSVSALDAVEDVLREIARKDGVVSLDEATRVQEPLIHPEYHTRWMVERTGFVLRDDLGFALQSGVGYLDNSGNIVERACRALRRLGRPASLSALQQEMGTSYSPVAARGRLSACREIKRVGKDRWALSEWPHDEYTGISDEIAQEIEACGGVATLDHLAEVIPARYGVAESSVRGLVHAPRFVVGTNGTVRLREDADSINARLRSLRETPRCYRVRGTWVIRIEVDQDLVRGSGRACPVALAQSHGIAPGNRRLFTCRDSQVLLSWNDRAPSGPTFGSLRNVAARLACVEGDWLFFGPSDESSVAWRLPRTVSDTAQGVERAVLLTGGSADDVAHPRSWFADVLDLDKPADYRQITQAFRTRQEDELADLLPPSIRSRSREDAFQRMLDAIGGDAPS